MKLRTNDTNILEKNPENNQLLARKNDEWTEVNVGPSENNDNLLKTGSDGKLLLTVDDIPAFDDYYTKEEIDEIKNKTDLQAWLEIHTDKTEEDYFELYGKMLPVVNLKVDEEVRTNELKNGRWIYKKIIDCGPGPANSKTVPLDTSEFEEIWFDQSNSYTINVNNIRAILPTTSSNLQIEINRSNNTLILSSNASWSNWTMYICVAYTKTVDPILEDNVAVSIDKDYIKGDIGDPGPQGIPGINFKGKFNLIIEYQKHDTVTYNGRAFYYNSDTPTIGIIPPNANEDSLDETWLFFSGAPEKGFDPNLKYSIYCTYDPFSVPTSIGTIADAILVKGDESMLDSSNPEKIIIQKSRLLFSFY